MLYLETPSGFEPWNFGPIDGILHPPNIGAVWSPEELAEVGLYAPVRPEVPAGKQVVSESVQRVGGGVTFVYDLQDEPAPILTRIPKDYIWRRATDQEAEAMEAALAAQPIRLRRIYEGANYISTADELYIVLQMAMIGLFGAERAAELLEPTE